MDISWTESALRREWGNTYRAIDLLCEEMTNLWEESHEQFYRCLIRLLRLHRAFYRIAVELIVSEDSDENSIQEYKEAIRSEQRQFIELLRWMQHGETMLEKIFRDRRVHELVSFLEKLVDDILADWKIEEWTNDLIYYPDE